MKIKHVYEFTNGRKVTKREFIKWFQKKFLYTVRKFKMISNGDVVGYENKGNFREAVLENLLNMFTERAMTGVERLPCKKVSKIAIPSTTDTESDKMAHVLVTGGTNSLKTLAPVNKKVIKPLFLFLDKEVMLYCNLMKLKCKKVKEEKDNLSKFVDDLEKKHPEIKHSIIKSYLELYPK